MSKQVDSSNISTVSSSDQKPNLVSDKFEKKTEIKKQTSWFNFINQKLSEWPLWKKFTSNQPQQSDVKVQPQISQQMRKIKRIKFRAYRLRKLPWHQIFFRSLVRPAYEYYHCPEDNKTYFWYSKSERHPKHKEVKWLDYNRETYYVLDTPIARELLAADKRFQDDMR